MFTFYIPGITGKNNDVLISPIIIGEIKTSLCFLLIEIWIKNPSKTYHYNNVNNNYLVRYYMNINSYNRHKVII